MMHQNCESREEGFVPYQTMFKSSLPRETKVTEYVECLNCGAAFPVKDLLEGELEENSCPTCKVTAKEFWKDKPSRPVPEYN